MIVIEEPILFIKKKLSNALNKNLLKFAIFGSRARGDHSENSDLDILIVLTNKDQEIIKKIRLIEVEFLDKFDILSSALIYDEKEWELRKEFRLAKNIIREGIFL